MRRWFWIGAEWLFGLSHTPERIPQGCRCSRCGESAATEHELLGGDPRLSWLWQQGKRK